MKMDPNLLSLAIFLLLPRTHGQIPLPIPQFPPLPEPAAEFLDAHNQARAAVGLQPLIWSHNLANATSLLVRYQRNNMGCQFANLNASVYGGNQLWAGSAAAEVAPPRTAKVTPRTAVEDWVKEKDFYNHTFNSCASGHDCGVYTQVVWRNTVELGCSQASCVAEKASLTICFYDPPGNVVGESPY